MLIADIDKNGFLNEFEKYLKDILDECEGATGDAMRYAALDGGKRVRPLCVYFGARSAGGNVDVKQILPIAAAVELVHNYSLVHDDMPEMDNDDMRRGKPSVHKKFGTATALLTGDGLLTLASTEMLKGDTAAEKEISNAALDMVYGQSAELAGCKGESEWLDMYSKKTGALIRGAFRAGALCAGADTAQIKTITKIAEDIGLSFQIADDLLDDDPSIIDVIGKDTAHKILEDCTMRAEKNAGMLANSAELIKFIEELRHRQS